MNTEKETHNTLCIFYLPFVYGKSVAAVFAIGNDWNKWNKYRLLTNNFNYITGHIRVHISPSEFQYTQKGY